jgi:hypothetical protein
MKAAEWLGGRYTGDPPLLQVANSREKVARMSVALAARTYSTDATGEQVVVTKQHVQDATNFLDQLYSYENFGYRRISKRRFKNMEIARAKRGTVKRWLQENPRLLEFLIDKGGESFRSNDIEEMAFMERSEVNMALGFLSEAKMIGKKKSQIIMEPELQQILRELEH